MVTFDNVLPELLRVCEQAPGFSEVTRACAVRDLVGRVRLALKVPDSASLDPLALEVSLAQSLQQWFAPPVLVAGHSGARHQRELGRLAATVLGIDEPWLDASWEDAATGTRRRPPQGRWHKLERRLSKTSWTGRRPSAPLWPLAKGTPAIVTFYSFKGGVGRTTLLASVAWQLAARGKRVICVDLDVEAPGLGVLMGRELRRGVVDFLVDFVATDKADLTDIRIAADGLGQESDRIDVVPAGTLDEQYFEKLARLDFVGSGLADQADGSPVHRALRVLIQALAGTSPSPDYILLDSRAGLHDVAGLSLHDLAHVDVLVARDSEQAYRGLDLTVASMGRRRASNDLQCVVVQTMAPSDLDSDEYRRVTSEFRHRSWSTFAEHVYPVDVAATAPPDGGPSPGGTPDAQRDPAVEAATLEDDSAAAEETTNAAHYPWVIRTNANLARFAGLAAVRPELFAEEYRRVADRIEALCTPNASGE